MHFYKLKRYYIENVLTTASVKLLAEQAGLLEVGRGKRMRNQTCSKKNAAYQHANICKHCIQQNKIFYGTEALNLGNVQLVNLSSSLCTCKLTEQK